MATLTAPDILKARRLVVKIGSALLVDRASGLRKDWLVALALDVAAAKARGTLSSVRTVDLTSGDAGGHR